MREGGGDGGGGEYVSIVGAWRGWECREDQIEVDMNPGLWTWSCIEKCRSCAGLRAYNSDRSSGEGGKMYKEMNGSKW